MQGLAAWYSGKIIMSGQPAEVRTFAKALMTGQATGHPLNYKQVILRPAILVDVMPSLEAVRDSIEERKHEISEAIAHGDSPPLEKDSRIAKEFPGNCPEDNMAMRQIFGWRRLNLMKTSEAVEAWRQAGKTIEWDELKDAIRCVEGHAKPQTFLGALFAEHLFNFVVTRPQGDTSCN